MLDAQVRSVLTRLEEQDRDERERGLSASERSNAVEPSTGRFLFSLVSPNGACSVLEIGSSRGYSSIWLAAGARYLGGRLLGIERDPARAAMWRENISAAGLDDWADLAEGEAQEILASLDDAFDVVFLDAAKSEYEELFELALPLVEPGALIVADNVLSNADTLSSYSEARQSDPRLSSVTVPLDRGLELTVVLSRQS